MKKRLSLFCCIFAVLLTACSQPQKEYFNYAEGKPVEAFGKKAKQEGVVTDGNLEGICRGKTRKGAPAVKIDLTAEFKLGGAHVYLGGTNSTPLAAFHLEYQKGSDWVKIPGAVVTDNYSPRVSLLFKEVISTTALRLVSDAGGWYKISEIQLWGKDVPKMPHGLKEKKEAEFKAEKHWVCANQIAYNVNTPKRFTVPTAKTDLPFKISEKKSGKVVFEGKLQNKIGDFTAFNPESERGVEYVITVEGDGLPKGESYPFEIGKQRIQEMAYQSAVDFMNDARSIVGTHPSAYGGTAWRDGTYYTYELPSMVILYLSKPDVFEKMPVTMSWKKDHDLVMDENFKPVKSPQDKDALAAVRNYYSNMPAPKSDKIPDLLQAMRFTVGWILSDPATKDPSGDPLPDQIHNQTVEQLAFFLYGFPAYKKHFKEEFYKMTLDSTLKWWGETGLYDVITKVGTGKGRHAPGHSILPNLLMYQVAKRENLENADKFMQAAVKQTQWVIDSVDWKNPRYTKGQRMSEQKLITGLALFQKLYPEQAPKGLSAKIKGWAESVVALSDNMWDFRRFDDYQWTLPGFNEAGNIIGFPACALSASMCLEEGKLKDRIVELAYSHMDNVYGRNPKNAHCANHPENGFVGIDNGWPFKYRYDVCARLEIVRGSLSSLPGSEMYPFNPNAKGRHPEGWTVYNAVWNVSLAFMNFTEGVSDVTILKEIK